MDAYNKLHPSSKAHKPIACILAMARATPPTCFDQRTYADFYFDVTNSADKTELKKKFARICEKSGVDTRYSILSEDFLKAHPEFYTPGKPSLEERNAIFAKEVPKLAHEASVKAIREWGRPASEITHLIVSTLTGVAIPGADVALVKSLGLSPDVNRIMLYMLGCYAGVSALRIAKDIAENNSSARILICCSELSAPTFRAPDERYTYDLVATSLFGDGASGVIVGAFNPSPNLPPTNPLSCKIMGNCEGNGLEDINVNSDDAAAQEDDENGTTEIPHSHTHDTPAYNCNEDKSVSDLHNHHRNGNDIANYVNGHSNLAHSGSCSDDQNGAMIPSPTIVSSASHDILEKPMYEIHWAGETLAADTEGIIEGKLKLDGLQFYLDRTLPSLVGKHVGPFCKRALAHAKGAGGKRNLGLGLGKEEEEEPRVELGFNDLFWAVHSGGPAILNAVEAAMELQGGKLRASREILRKYGNVSASTVLFVLHELATSPHLDASEWGIAIAFGPGVTIEGALLRRPT